jgi:hypothetical protein
VHEPNISMAKAALAEIDGGADIALKVKLLCPSNCNLQGCNVKVIDGEGAVAKEIELVSFDGTANETDEFVVKAPIKPGGYTWTAMFTAQEKEGVLHGESSTPFSFTVKPHATSIAVWDVPSPVVFNSRFNPKVGIRCCAECKLTGKEIEIYDHKGAKVATTTLGDLPWTDTTALYWTEIELNAPGTEGYYTWTVTFPKPDLELPHEGISTTFAFRTTKPPDHVVTVEVIDVETKTPIKNAHVVLYPFRGYTDEHGVVRVSVPKGKYDLDILMQDYQPFRTTAEVAGDATVKTELLFWPMGRQ